MSSIVVGIACLDLLASSLLRLGMYCYLNLFLVFHSMKDLNPS